MYLNCGGGGSDFLEVRQGVFLVFWYLSFQTNFEIHKHKSYELACETRNRGLRILGTNTAKAGPRSPPAPPSWLKPVQMH